MPPPRALPPGSWPEPPLPGRRPQRRPRRLRKRRRLLPGTPLGPRRRRRNWWRRQRAPRRRPRRRQPSARRRRLRKSRSNPRQSRRRDRQPGRRPRARSRSRESRRRCCFGRSAPMAVEASGARRRNSAVDFDWVRERLEEKRRELFGRYNRDLTAGLKASTGEGAEDLVDRGESRLQPGVELLALGQRRHPAEPDRRSDGPPGRRHVRHLCPLQQRTGPRQAGGGARGAPYCVDCQELEEKGRLPADE